LFPLPIHPVGLNYSESLQPGEYVVSSIIDIDCLFFSFQLLTFIILI
jgi:hypothetical protein